MLAIGVYEIRPTPSTQGLGLTFGGPPVWLPDMPLGTQDFYFDIADRLNELDVEFLILVRDGQQKAVSLVGNTADPETMAMFAKAAIGAAQDDTE